MNEREKEIRTAVYLCFDQMDPDKFMDRLEQCPLIRDSCIGVGIRMKVTLCRPADDDIECEMFAGRAWGK